MARRRYTRELLQPIVARAFSVAEVLRLLEMRQSGGSHTHISKQIRTFGLDTSHFLGGRRNQGSAHLGGPAKKSASEILVEKPDLAPRTRAAKLRRALGEIDRPFRCEICGLDQWHDSALTLEIDHINGRPNDNRRENLRLLCPNCHSQTETYCARNVRVSELLGLYEVA
ncbi:MAG: HNH endonuclease signature motif containing protein [Chloroflexota bacterium]